MSVTTSQQARRNTPAKPPPSQAASPPEIDFPPLVKRPCFCLYKMPFLSSGVVYESGLYWHAILKVKDADESETEEPFDSRVCSVIDVVAIVRTGAGKEHSYLIEYVPHGEIDAKREVLSQAALLGRAEDALKALRDIGVSVLQKNAKLVRAWLDEQHLRFSAHHPEDFWESVKHVGWHGEKTFVLPGEIIGEQSKVWFAGKGDVAEYGKRGSISSWQTNVVCLCCDNPYLQFGLSLAFAGPLLELLNIPGIAIHFYGDSTGGKTTCQFVSISIWGSPRFLLTWSGTVNGLESQAASRSSTLTALDESQLIDPKQLDNGIYLLLGGTSKSRMNRDATAKAILRWSPAIFSSGEHSTQANLTTKNTDHKAGQAVRMIDVPVVAKYGVFDYLHNGCSAKEFAENLKAAAADNYGFAGPLFVEHLIKSRTCLDLKGRLALASAEIVDGATLSAQEGRVLRSFALVALAGELATEAGILPWKAHSAQTAAQRLFGIWRTAQPQSAHSREHVQILEKIANFIARHGDTRFTDIKPRMHYDYTDPKNSVLVKDDEQPKAYDRAGYWKEIGSQRVFLFSSGGLKDATVGYDFGRVLRALDEADAFAERGTPPEKAKRHRTPDGTNQKFYWIDPEKLSPGS